ncbi:MAG: class I SAM-dependent methyltransferase [Pirellulaceae bacterium]|nr:class I SAM-dependent methyltransferase [Pirellulaceae bacterium]
MSQFDREKWNAKYRDPEFGSREPSAVLVGLAGYLPARGRALDLAGGAGRHGIWLAGRGLDVTIADISPVGLARARERAAERGVAIETLETDLEDGPFPAGPWDLVVSVCFLGTRQLPAIAAALAPGGTLIVIQPTKTNLERHDKPPEAFLLNDGELPGLVEGLLSIVHYEEGWQADGRHDAVLVARKG